MNYWLWIIPDNEATGLWDFCRQTGVAAMEYQIGVNPKAKLHYNLGQQIAIGDKVVAYLNNSRIGGVGTVTKKFFEDAQGYQSPDGFPYRHRIGVNWLTTDTPIDFHKLPGIDFNALSPKLHTQTIHQIKQNECELIEKAIQIAHQNPLPGIATMLTEVPLEDEKCKQAKLWKQSVIPVTRSFLEYIGTLIQHGMRLRQDKTTTLKFRRSPQKTKIRANTRDSVYFENSKGYQFWVCYGRDIEGLTDKFIWGLLWWGRNVSGQEVNAYFESIKMEKEISICTKDGAFAGTYCLLINQLTATELRAANPIDLAHRVFEDLMNLYQRTENNAYLSNTKELEGNMTGLMNFIQAQGFHFPASLVTTYYLSLQTKPFVILTGISGTGKTKLAQLFAKWMSPAIEIQSEVKEEPLGDAESFYIEVQPSYLKSGLIIPKRAYGYFDLAEPGHTKDVKVQLGNSGQVVSAAMRNQIHTTSGGSYVYFFYKKPLREWLNANFEPGDILKFQVIKENTEYRLSKFTPTIRRIIKHTPRMAFISVRPDWTDNRGLMGFYNLITGAYQTTDFLRLLLQATVDPASPHFIILDEMNLAKVEHYFADFLSVLESRYLQDDQLKQEPLRLHDLPRCVMAQSESPQEETPDVEVGEQAMCQVRCTGCPLRDGVTEAQQTRGESTYEDACKSGFDPLHYVPPRLLVPLNVYFSGTVNVDETTYMFSPKVLDRANTIEFNEVNLAEYFAKSDAATTPDAAADEAARTAFTFKGEFLRLPKSVSLRTDPVLAPYREQLIELNDLLKAHTLHFGYRVADEILLYLWNARELNDPAFTLDIAFDYQICQKILPKFHGSQARLQEPLHTLLEFCNQHQYNHSAAKVKRMLEALNKEGFASFA